MPVIGFVSIVRCRMRPFLGLQSQGQAQKNFRKDFRDTKAAETVWLNGSLKYSILMSLQISR
jgi:hypothetical protein